MKENSSVFSNLSIEEEQIQDMLTQIFTSHTMSEYEHDLTECQQLLLFNCIKYGIPLRFFFMSLDVETKKSLLQIVFVLLYSD